MQRHITSHYQRLSLTALLMLLLISAAYGQGTAFTYQGKLSDSGNPANGSYDLQFKLFDTVTVGTGTQQGSTVTVSSVSVTGGIFTVQLDFGASVFTGADRFLETAVRPAGGGDPYTTLSPRQPLTSSPYTIRSLSAATADYALNASQLGGLAASGFIQNTTAPQAATNFNISGTGTAGVLNAATQFNLGGSRVLSTAGTGNLFAGLNAGISNTSGELNSYFGGYAGAANTAGSDNAFFGAFAGGNNTTGASNAFFGRYAGLANTTASGNAFFGASAGLANTTGYGNSFFGESAGNKNTIAPSNSFFGYQSGFKNTTGQVNSFFGYQSGYENIDGTNNSFFGYNAGLSNTQGSANSFFGSRAGIRNTTGSRNLFFGESAASNNTTGWRNTFVGQFAGGTNTTEVDNTLVGYNTDLMAGVTNATAIGSQAYVAQSNSLVLGSIDGVNDATASTKVGIGTTAPIRTLDVRDGNGGSIQVGAPVAGSTPKLIYFGDGAFVYLGEQDADDRLVMRASLFRFLGGNVEPEVDNTAKLGGSTNRWKEVWAANGTIQTSDARLKQSVTDLRYGLAEVMRLRPVSFLWKGSNDPKRHLGLIAQEVEPVIPELIHKADDPSAPLGLNYADLVPLLIKSAQQQQAQISQYQAQLETQQQQVNQLQQQVDSLKRLICKDHPQAESCR